MEEFKRELAEILEVDDVRPGDVLTAFETWDSLSALSVIVMIERDYKVTLSGSEMKGAKTVQDLYELVTQKRSASKSGE
jgi:acyl carrier protein